jgi:hypothetical protein
MPDKKRAGEPDPKPTYTTFRLYATDGEDLSEYADKVGKSIAETYRELGFPEVVRQKLIKLAEARLQDLKARRPQ